MCFLWQKFVQFAHMLTVSFDSARPKMVLGNLPTQTKARRDLSAKTPAHKVGGIYVCTYRAVPLDVIGVLLVYIHQLRHQLPTVHGLQVEQGEPPSAVLEVGEGVKLPQEPALLGLATVKKVVGLHHQ